MISIEQPFFSVIIPTRNRELLLRRAIASVLAQDFESYEIVVVNDASDNSYDVSCYENVHNLVYIHNRENLGQAETRNLAVNQASGRYLVFLDDDDELSSNFLSMTYQYHKARSFDVDMSWSSVTSLETVRGKVVAKPIVWGRQYQSYEHSPVRLLRSGLGYGVVITKELFSKVGGLDSSFKLVEDTEFFTKFLSQGYFPHEITSTNVFMHVHRAVRLTKDVNTFKNRILEIERVLSLYRSYFDHNFNSKSDLHWTIRGLEIQIEDALKMKSKGILK
ncbi:glycosyltransferase family A protein [Teredinibacter sp. KSP-S5-2]|uniref:glycosyltransferase family 2 protein n=1 Tax=Teredinibacter sp. KSP-S5-2 TaxID=3034506 RepID=UPI0029350337|nr:glycosyltransferase family A protein [Teredinibacter sp. KSP-S5-2]WNO11321.1 glycosyltransferase family A protein [Teredinibacter sp. KSP-S5-2]